MPELAPAYAAVFSGPPWNETWTPDTAAEAIRKDFAAPGFVGVLVRTPQLIGFTWAFTIPSGFRPEKFGSISELLRKRDLDLNQVIYGSESGVVPTSQGRGIGTGLLQRRIASSPQPYGVFTTINPVMVRVYKKVAGPTNLEVLCGNPDPTQRSWYLIDQRTVLRGGE